MPADLTERQQIEQELQESLRFEQLLSTLSTTFINLPASEVDQKIEEGLKLIVEFLDIDRSSVGKVADDCASLTVTHSYAVPGIPAMPTVILNQQLPWYTENVCSGKVIALERLPDDLPDEAVREKQYAQQVGLKSQLTIPLKVGGALRGALGFASFRRQRAWPEDLIRRLCLIGEILANALDRKRVEEALAKSARRWQLMADSLPVLIAYVDREQRYRFNNRAYEKWFSLRSEQIQERSIQDLIGDAAYGLIRNYVKRALAGEQVRFEMDVPDNDGALRPIEALYVPHLDEAGQVLGFFVLIQDITERKRADLEEQKHREELAHVLRVATMGELAASLAHELNQPLAAILSNARAAEHLLDGNPPDLDEVHDALADIVEDDKRAGEIIRRLRALLQKHEFNGSPLDLNQVIREVIPLVRNTALKNNIKLTLRLASALPAVQGDRTQLQQVLINLILNGLEAMQHPECRPRELMVQTAQGDPDTVMVSIRDFGIGLNPATVDHIFDPFFTTKTGGMGMGLAISQSIIKAHGGRLWATSNPDGGAIFHFTVPATREIPA